jgi:hypothetical protein
LISLPHHSSRADQCALDSATSACNEREACQPPEAFDGWLVGIGRYTCQRTLRDRTSTPAPDPLTAWPMDQGRALGFVNSLLRFGEQTGYLITVNLAQ